MQNAWTSFKSGRFDSRSRRRRWVGKGRLGAVVGIGAEHGGYVGRRRPKVGRSLPPAPCPRRRRWGVVEGLFGDEVGKGVEDAAVPAVAEPRRRVGGEVVLEGREAGCDG